MAIDHEDQFPSLCGETLLFEIDLEDPQDLEKVRPVGRSRQLDLARDESFAHSGRASLRLGVTDPGGAQQLNPSIEIELSPAIPASEIMAIFSAAWLFPGFSADLDFPASLLSSAVPSSEKLSALTMAVLSFR